MADLAADRQDILQFWQTDFPAWPPAKFDMFYQSNPDGAASCFVARDQEQRLVGAIALFPRRMMVNGNVLKTAVAGDLAIRKDHRGTGLAQMLRALMLAQIQKSDLDFVYGTANVISKKVLEKGEFQAIGDTVRMVKVLRTERYIRRYLKWPLLARAVAAPTDAVLKRRYRKYSPAMEDVYRWDVLSAADARFDGLWQEARSMYSIIGERSARFLNWRFVNCPYKSFQIFGLGRRKDGELVGYVVYQPTAEGVHIEDFFATEPDRMLRILLSEFLKFQRQKGADAVTFYFLGDEKITRMFEQFGFVRRGGARSMVIHINDNHPQRNDILNPRRWHFLYADNDVDA
jgi:GNAT superfamily N-acetyltransferase